MQLANECTVVVQLTVPRQYTKVSSLLYSDRSASSLSTEAVTQSQKFTAINYQAERTIERDRKGKNDGQKNCEIHTQQVGSLHRPCLLTLIRISLSLLFALLSLAIALSLYINSTMATNLIRLWMIVVSWYRRYRILQA